MKLLEGLLSKNKTARDGLEPDDGDGAPRVRPSHSASPPDPADRGAEDGQVIGSIGLPLSKRWGHAPTETPDPARELKSWSMRSAQRRIRIR